MKSFRSKASRFFREGASSEEKGATKNTSQFEFDAGTDSTATRKVTWPFRRKDGKVDKPQPVLRLNSSSSTLLPPAIPRVIARESNDDFNFLPDYDDSDDDDTQAFRRSPAASNKKKMYRNAFSMSNLKKSCSNLAALKNNGSRIFSSHKKPYSTSPPPPPVPQIPIDFTIPLPTRYSAHPPPPPPPPIPKRSSNRPPPPKLKKAKSSTGPISRPTPTSQDSAISPLLNHLATTPFTPRNRSPPQRPPRPSEVANDTLMYMRHTNARMVLPVRPRTGTTASSHPSQSTSTFPSTSASTATSKSTPSTTSTTYHTNANAIASRLGIPTGHSTPLTPSLAAPLAAQIPQHPTLRLPVCVTDGSTRYSRFSEFVAGCEPAAYAPALRGGSAPGYEHLGARLSTDALVEVYAKDKEDEWVLERQVSKGEKGEAGGMVFRDRRGGFHFVKNL